MGFDLNGGFLEEKLGAIGGTMLMTRVPCYNALWIRTTDLATSHSLKIIFVIKLINPHFCFK